jgi:aerobic carbon-monoxide dehydrogenase large subunit
VFVGKSVARREDDRLLRGEGQYVADVQLRGMLHAVFVGTAHAHARIRHVDVSRAAAAPGVVWALTGADLLREMPPVKDNQAALPKSGIPCSLTARSSAAWQGVGGALMEDLRYDAEG